MLIKTLLVIFLVGFFACKNKPSENQYEKFDKVKWATKEGKVYPYRDKMITYLIDNQKLKGIKKGEVLNLLGPPNRTDTNYLFYTVAQRFLGDIPVPLHTRSLVIKFNKDTVEWRKIHE